MMAFVLLVILMSNGHAASGCGAPLQIQVLSESVTVSGGETGHFLSQGKQHFSQDATPPSGLYYGLQKAGTPLKSFSFTFPVDEVIPPYAAKASGRGCFIKYFYLSIQPQAP
ncbi:hypothetical protein K3G39_16150 [Pontibacter sp. HSC-14F20]|uniref:hypothetical protein n=1 Tax=Pontibacter sp. HSC-14F20 TaxID=2864136 RepID=UPI001C731411|nr:hypothetical protein [Pontibacter sp. HSC-14F20]MBX0334774.1 hypothetical protein [Pontibacter sp. HSC-14F20]